MAYKDDEESLESGNPIECFDFLYAGVHYSYTSAQYQQGLNIDGSTYMFVPEYITRSDSLKLGDSSGSVETCTVTVPRNNPIAMLYQGAPPEDDSVLVKVYRKHGEGLNDYIIILQGNVSQVGFSGSEAEITVTVENILNREVPRGTMSYYCQNCIYDNKCKLNAANYAMTCYLDQGRDNLTLFSSNLLTQPSGYYTDGFMKMGNIYRAIHLHYKNYIRIKYPIPKHELQGSFTVYPGCRNLFTECARKFGNTDNFSGVPYIQPFDAYRNPVSNRQVYWVDGNIVRRDTNGELFSPGL